MTNHLKTQNYTCANCSMIFIPFRLGISCPSCGTLTPYNIDPEFLDFISVCSENMKQNVKKNGTYRADVWYIGNYSDWMQSNIFDICELIRIKNPPNLQCFLVDKLSECDWDEPTIKHAIEITLAIYAKMTSATRTGFFNKIKQNLLKKITFLFQ